MADVGEGWMGCRGWMDGRTSKVRRPRLCQLPASHWPAQASTGGAWGGEPVAYFLEFSGDGRALLPVLPVPRTCLVQPQSLPGKSPPPTRESAEGGMVIRPYNNLRLFVHAIQRRGRYLWANYTCSSVTEARDVAHGILRNNRYPQKGQSKKARAGYATDRDQRRQQLGDHLNALLEHSNHGQSEDQPLFRRVWTFDGTDIDPVRGHSDRAHPEQVTTRCCAKTKTGLARA
jgi:hypothetical protein